MSGTCIAWFARSVEAAGLEQARRLAQALSLEVIASTGHLLMLKGSHGEIIEYCGPEHPTPPHLFAEHDCVIGFAVEHLEEASAKMSEAGFSPCTDITEGGDVRFQHFIGVEGRVVGLLEHSKS